MNGQVCIVTGAGSGIGEATAVRLAGLGAVPVLVGPHQVEAGYRARPHRGRWICRDRHGGGRYEYRRHQAYRR